MQTFIPQPALERICRLRIILLEQVEQEKRIDSNEISVLTGVAANTVRKDISYLEGYKGSKQGYTVAELITCIEENLKLSGTVRTCIVGLGKLGSAMLDYPGFLPAGYKLTAGFDSDINVIELMKTDIPLFPAYDIEEQAERLNIELGIIAVPSKEAQKTCSRLVAAGVNGILNFTSCTLHVPEKIVVRNISFLHEFDIISALLADKQ